MEDLFWLVISHAVVFYVGFRLGLIEAASRWARRMVEDPNYVDELHRKLKRVAQAYQQSQEEDGLCELEVIKEGEQFLLYRKRTNEFVSQGGDLEQALERAHQRFPEEQFRGLIAKEQAQKWGLAKDPN
jgi:hypothetical protein